MGNGNISRDGNEQEEVISSNHLPTETSSNDLPKHHKGRGANLRRKITSKRQKFLGELGKSPLFKLYSLGTVRKKSKEALLQGAGAT